MVRLKTPQLGYTTVGIKTQYTSNFNTMRFTFIHPQPMHILIPGVNPQTAYTMLKSFWISMGLQSNPLKQQYAPEL